MKILVIIALVISSNTYSQSKQVLKNEIIKMEKLISGLDLGKSSQGVIEGLGKYKYENDFIENIKIESLLDNDFRNQLINSLRDFNSEDEPNALMISIITQLLIVRMEQLQDSNSFFILSKLSMDHEMSYMGADLYCYNLVYLFFDNPDFFLKESYKYNNTLIMETVTSNLSALTESTLLEREGSCPAKSGMILIYQSSIDQLKESSSKKKIQSQKLIRAEFKLVNPIRLEKSENYFYDIHPFLNDVTKNNLDKNELKFYSEKIQPLFDEISIHNYHVQDKDGYVNIRKKANVSSDVVGIARNGEYVCFVSTSIDDPNWVYIKYEGIHGYVHKSRLVRK